MRSFISVSRWYASISPLCTQKSLFFPHPQTYNGRTGETTYEDILKCQPRFPKWVSPTAKDFIIRLLTRDPEKRLGSKYVSSWCRAMGSSCCFSCP